MSTAAHMRSAGAHRSTRQGDGPEVGWDAERQRYTARDAWRCPASALATVMDIVSGSTEIVTVNSIFGSRWIPLRYEPFPDKLIAVRASATGEGLDGDGNRTSYLIQVDYESPNHAIGAGANVDISTRPAVFPMAVPPGSGTVGATPNAFGRTREVQGHFIDAVLDGLQSFTPANWIFAGVPVNNATWRGYPEGTVALRPVQAEQGPAVGAGFSWRVRFPFEMRAVPWGLEYQDGSLAALDPGDGATFVPTNFTTLLGF
jgi:hypothetical protein